MSNLGLDEFSRRTFRSLLERTSEGSFPEGSRSLKRRSRSGTKKFWLDFRSLLDQKNLFLEVLGPAEEVLIWSSSAGSQALEEVVDPAVMEPADRDAAETKEWLE